MRNIWDLVEKTMVEQLAVNEAEVTPEASITDDLGADSLDCIELVMTFEEELGIEIPDEDVDKATTNGAKCTVQTVVDYLEGRLAK
jgi:acyl carrier protein